MFIIRDREAGNRIEAVETYEEALELVEEYEEEDKRDGSYTEDFYEIVESQPQVLFGDFERDGLEVGINEDGKLYVADARNIEYADDTPENREEFIADAKKTIAEWKSGR